MTAIYLITGESEESELRRGISKFLQETTSQSSIPSEYSPLWDGLERSLSFKEIAEELLAAMEVMAKHYVKYSQIKGDPNSKTVEDLKNYYQKPRGPEAWFSADFWVYRRARLRICEVWDGTHHQFESYLEYKLGYKEALKHCRLFTSGLPPSEPKFQEFRGWVSTVCKQIRGFEHLIKSAVELLPDRLSEGCSKSYDSYLSTLKEVNFVISEFHKIDAIDLDLKHSWLKLNNFLEVTPLFTVETCLPHLESLLTRMDDLNILDIAEIKISDTAQQFKVPNLPDIIISEFELTSKDWEKIVESSVLNFWNDEVISSSKALRAFDSDQLSSTARTFIQHEKSHRAIAQLALRNEFAKRWDPATNSSGLKLLGKESNKQRKILSPREIMEKGALETMLQLKPCWLMSPLSISQILPLEKELFDVIIFDEASQVRVEDAIPSIYRAGTMIVVGDNKQMPPTNFFAGAVPDDDEEDEPISPSILDMALNVYPSVLLEWHYRSQSEALIAFSNRAFYGGRLIAPPNPRTLGASGSIKYFEIKDAYFSSAKGNKIEAEAVARHLIHLLRDGLERSYGIIAMGQSQAQVIEDTLEELADETVELRTLYERAKNRVTDGADTGLFIKNLENVQGDERDIILVSIGYAPMGPGKKLRQSFGPLSVIGGARRLNVAITRAKKQIHIFSSFSPSTLETSDELFDRSPDRCVFGRYLNYAKAISDGDAAVAEKILNSFGIKGTITSRKSSRFALDIKRRLEEIGYKVSAEIGTSGFFIDLGIHHPVLTSNYMVGIECDGAIFHSTPYARDRDKIRQNLLESRGWRILRVWSQDWSRDWKTELLRLDEEIKRIKQDSKIEIKQKASGE